MKTPTVTRGRTAGHPRDERGAALIIAVIVLGSLSLMALAALLSSGTEMKIARNERLHARAFWAAEAGLQWAMTEINMHTSATDPDYMGAPKTAAGLYDLTVPDTGPRAGGLPDGSTYEVGVGWKRDTKDQDESKDPGDAAGNGAQANYTGSYTGSNELVYYNPWYGYGDSAAPSTSQNAGYPIQIVRSVGRSGASTVEVKLELGREPMNVSATIHGALTASSNVQLTGNVMVDGRDHDINGNYTTTGCAEDKQLPAISTTPGHSVDQGGSSDMASDGPSLWTATDDAATYPNSPEEVLGLDFDSHGLISGGATLDQMKTASPLSAYMTTAAAAPDQISGIVYITGSYARPGENSQGILIVHNPLFDPMVWNVSDPDSIAYNALSPLYDPRLDPGAGGYDAAYQTAHAPANLGNWNSNIVFKGIVIADKIDKINGNSTIIGAVISLSTIETKIVGNGSAEVLYSCEAVAQAASGVTSYNLKLSWTRE